MNERPSTQPILFFSTVVHYGGSNQVTVALARRMQRQRPVLVVDAYGNCREYMAALAASQIDTRVVSPHSKRGVIGGVGLVSRYLRFAWALPEMRLLVRRLRRLLREVRPAVVAVAGEKALYAVERAAPESLPIVYYLMGNLGRRPWYIRRLFPRIDLLVAISQETLHPAVDYGPRQTAVVYNGLDVEDVERLARAPAPPLPRADRTLRLLFPATLLATKGQDVALKAVARARAAGQAVQLWLSSEKPRGSDAGFPARLAELIVQLGLEDCVSFIGWQDNICSVMATSDAVILTSRSEGMPCALMQAMALQKPVLATRVGGIPELVRDGTDGLLVDVGDVAATSAAIARLADPELRARLGAAGKARVGQEFSLKRQANALLTLLDATAAGHGNCRDGI
jgi:glycosyltransferase involved in cell wall biosynthesis